MSPWCWQLCGSPALAGRGTAQHLDDARPGRGGGVVRQRIDREEAVRHDLAVGHRCGHLAEAAHDEQRDMVAPGIPVVEEYAVQLWRLGNVDIAFFTQLARDRLRQCLANLDPAARQV